MVDNMEIKKIEKLCDSLKECTEKQIILIERVIEQFRRSYIKIEQLPSSDIMSKSCLQDFGDALRIHHCFSKEPFTKDKFEYALERTLISCGVKAELAPRGNPGHDITINGIRFSLKTQADSNIRKNKLHISKFMELGKGVWGDSVEDLIGLRKQFFCHMEAYDRILSLRCLSKNPPNWHYELIEIPKELFKKANKGELRIQSKSKQNPKPGYCEVKDNEGNIEYQLYFDGGTERKLQIKNLLKNSCIIHATWIFSTE